MVEKIVPIIMAGGRGTRLWPLSRAAAPKQFIRLLGDQTLFQKTLSRVAHPDLYEAPIIITNSDFRFLVAEQARALEMDLAAIILEPMARNTAPAISAAALVAAGIFGKNSMVQVLTSDHEITADQAYFECIDTARETAATGKLVTFGIAPRGAATGYGYIEAGEPLATGAHSVNCFIEKPEAQKAERLVAAGNFYWNSGMFMFSIPHLSDELRRHAPDVFRHTEEAVQKAKQDLDFTRLDSDAFSRAPNISIDYAIMEKTDRAAVVPSAIDWTDLGSWDAVWKLGAQDANGNVALGNTTLVNTKGTLAISRGAHLAVQGMQDIAVIASEDSVYVGRLEDSQQVGKLVEQMRSDPETADLTNTHPTSYRPWGGYTSVLTGDRFQVKRIFVQPEKKLSLQKHHHRSEHWIVVKGTAEITIGDTVRMLQENESVYVPAGAVHRLANPGKIQLELIEVQTGSYLGEDDIIRLVDEFGRD